MTDHKVYIRVKRRNQTYCLICNPSDTVHTIKKQITQAVNQHSSDENNENTLVSVEQLRLLLPASSSSNSSSTNQETTILNDNESIAEYNLKDNAILYVVFAVSDSEYESIDVISTDLQVE